MTDLHIVINIVKYSLIRHLSDIFALSLGNKTGDCVCAAADTQDGCKCSAKVRNVKEFRPGSPGLRSSLKTVKGLKCSVKARNVKEFRPGIPEFRSSLITVKC
jgi:hypothetical protein